MAAAGFFKNKTYYIFVLVVLLIGISVCSYHTVLHKEGFFLDEIYTFLLSNNKIVSLNEFCSFIRDGSVKDYVSSYINSLKVIEFTQEDFMSKLSVPQGEGFNFFSVYIMQSIDVHPMLYYSIVHFISSITHYTDLKVIGFIINLFFQLITCVYLFLLTKTLVKNPWVSIITVAYYGFSFGFQNDSSYFRMYCVLTCWVTILCYLYYKLISNEYIYSRRDIFCISVIEFLALSTQYFSFVFIACFISLISKNIYQKYGKRKMCSFIKPHIIMLTLFLISWPQIIWHFISGYSQHAGFILLYKIYRYVKLFINSQFGGSCVLCLMFLLILIYVVYQLKGREKKKHKQMQIQFFVTLIISYIIVGILSPWADYRYVSFVMPIFSMFIIIVVRKFLLLMSDKIKFLSKENIRFFVLLCSVVIVSIAWRPVDNLPNMYKLTPQKVRFSEMYSDSPAIILNPDNTGIFIEIPYHYKHSYYIKIDNSCLKTALSLNMKDDKYVLYINKRLNLDEVFEMFAQLGYSYNKVDHSTMFHDIYMIGNN